MTRRLCVKGTLLGCIIWECDGDNHFSDKSTCYCITVQNYFRLEKLSFLYKLKCEHRPFSMRKFHGNCI